jgi:hypothetical protein
MIVSASRRSDIPAFHSAWFMEQFRRGEVKVRNPFHPAREKRVSLKKQDVAAFVFWSRDPRPLMEHLAEIEGGGYPSYFLITVTGYPRLLEPHCPRIEEAVVFFRELAGRIGRSRIIWRYDPVIFTEQTDFAFHVHNFSELATLLSPFAFRAVVSFFDPYPKVLRRLRKAGIDAGAAAGTPEQQAALLGSFAAVAAASGLEIQSCAEGVQGTAVLRGKCVDEGLLNELFSLNLSYRKDPSQRKLCLCQRSVDIGSYNTCCHGCLYCYAC